MRYGAAVKAAFVGFGVYSEIGGRGKFEYVFSRGIGRSENFFAVTLSAYAYGMFACRKPVEFE